MAYKKLDDFLKPREIQTANVQPQSQHQQKQEEPRYSIVGFYRETEFQETPIGKIPKEWKLVKLSELFRFRNGKRPSLIKEIGSIPVYGANGIMGYTDTALVEKDHVLIIGRVGASGKVHLAQGRVWVSDNAIYSDHYVKDKINPIFAYYTLKFLDLERYVSKTTHPLITQSFVKELFIPLPPLKEQWGIAEVLSSVDQAIEAVDRLIQKLESVKKALMQELLTKGIGHKEYQETPIGKIPKEWRIVKLGEVVEVYDNKRIPLSEQERAARKGPYPYCGANGVIDYIDDYIFDGEYLLLAEDGGFFGRFEQSAYIMNGKFWANNHVHVLKAREGKALNKFLMYILNFLDLKPYIVGSTRPKLTQSSMREIKISLPPLEEQMQIADILKSVDDRIDLEMKYKKKLESLKRGLMELLLSGRVRVKVVSLNPEIPSRG